MRGRGFSIIELVIAIVVLAVVSAIVMLQPPDLAGMRLSQAAHKLKSDIRFAQTYALACQKRTQVSFNRAGNNYSVLWEQSPGSWANTLNPLTKQNFIVNLGQGDYAGVRITQVDFGGADNNLVFDAGGIPYGYPSGGSATALSNNGTVTLSAGQTKVITVVPQTGKASES
jgi:prepilin-type N-terminal cleavage/methylation domain-containing protein